MHTLNESFNAKQSGTHPKGVQVTYLAVVGFLLLGSISIYRPQGVAATFLVRHDKNTLRIITQPKLALQVLNLSS